MWIIVRIISKKKYENKPWDASPPNTLILKVLKLNAKSLTQKEISHFLYFPIIIFQRKSLSDPQRIYPPKRFRESWILARWKEKRLKQKNKQTKTKKKKTTTTTTTLEVFWIHRTTTSCQLQGAIEAHGGSTFRRPSTFQWMIVGGSAASWGDGFLGVGENLTPMNMSVSIFRWISMKQISEK